MGHAETQNEITLRRKAAAAKAVATLRAKREAQMGEIRQSMTTDAMDISELEIVQLYLLSGIKKLDENTTPYYAPDAPVLGASHYVVLGRKDRKVTVFHPWTLTRFDVPALSFHPKAADPSVTMPKVMAAITERIRVRSAAQVEVPQYVGQIVSALTQKAAN